MLNKTSLLLAAAAVALTVGTANADDYGRNRDDYGHNRQDRGSSTLAINIDGIAFGYRDGYWDNGHHWHRWHHNRDYRNYRDENGSNYHNWNHDRDGDNGWQRH